MVFRKMWNSEERELQKEATCAVLAWALQMQLMVYGGRCDSNMDVHTPKLP